MGARGASQGGAGVARPALVLRWLALALALVGSPVAARDLDAQADLFWGRNEVGPARDEYLRQTYYLGWRRQVTDPISYRLSLRLEFDQGTQVVEHRRTPLWAEGWEPTAAISWRLESFALMGAYRRTSRTTSVGLARDTSVIERADLGLWVAPFTDGSVTLGLDRLGYTATAVESQDDRLSLGFRYAHGALALDNQNRLQHYQDARSGLWRTSMGPRLTVSWGGELSERLTTSLSYAFDYFRTEQVVHSSTVTTVATEVQGAMGLYLDDDLPLDTASMPPLPALVDRVFDVPVGVSLGPGGSSYQNLGLDLGRTTPTDEVRVHVRSSLGLPVLLGGPISWTAYWSLDGLHWVAVDGVSSSYSEGMSAWQVTFPRVAARYVKVVSFGVNTVDTQVTELQAFVHETFVPDRAQVTTTVRQTLGVGLGWRPWTWLKVGYSGLLDASAVTPPGGSVRWTTDLSNAGTAAAGPFRGLTPELSISQDTSRQPFGQSQSSLGVTGALRYQPIEQAGGSLELNRTDAWVTPSTAFRVTPTVHTVTHTGTARGQAAPWRTLTGTLSVALSAQEIDGGGTTRYVTPNAHVTAKVTRDLDLDLDLSAQQVLSRVGDTSAQEAIPFIRVLTYARTVLEARYHPSPQLYVQANGGWLGSEGRGGAVRNLRVNWAPFPEGSLRLTFDYVHDVDPFTGNTLRRMTAGPDWKLNPHATLRFSYNVVSGGTQVGQESLLLTFTLRS